jgi:hypothetical protein
MKLVVLALGGDVVQIPTNISDNARSIEIARQLVDALRAAGTRQFMVEVVDADAGEDADDATRVCFRYRQVVRASSTRRNDEAYAG